MACLNAAPVLNALETRILDAANENAKHVVIIGASDGRLARAIRKNVDDDAVFSLIEPRATLRSELNDFHNVHSDPFDLTWIKEQVEKNGSIDYLIFYHIHEYWKGNLNDFRQIVNQLSEEGSAWVSFLNGSARNIMYQFLPKNIASYGGLAQPVANATNMNYGSWISCLNMMYCETVQSWALLDPESYEFAQNARKSEDPPEPIEFDLNGLKLRIASMADALLYGGMFIGIQFAKENQSGEKRTPQFTAAAFNSNLYQSLLVPFPDNSLAQVSDFLAETEIRKWKESEKKELNVVGKYLLKECESFEGVNRILILGAKWGRDIALVQAEKPDWEITGMDASPHKVALGNELFSDRKFDLRVIDPEKPLPFEDSSYDLVITTGFLCEYHNLIARHLVAECVRVSKKGVIHFEDARGPVQSLQLKTLSIVESYASLGYEDVSLNPMKVGDQPTGYAISKVILDK